MKHYVYRLDDPITKEFYIGSRSCECEITEDHYVGSYKTWKPKDKSRLIKTILKSNFRKRETCIKYESILIKENIDDSLNRNYYIPNIGFHRHGLVHTEESKKKMREKRKNQIFSDETCKKISESGKGRIVSDETRKKISKGHLGITYEQHMGEYRANELKKLRVEYLTKNNPAKLPHVRLQLIERNINNNPMNSIEAREKLSKALKGNIPWNKGITWKTKKNR